MSGDFKGNSKGLESSQIAIAAADCGPHIAVIGLGYVGLPLATAFGQQLPTLGFDTAEDHIESLKTGQDPNREVDEALLQKASFLTFSAEPKQLAQSNIYIIAVPTPIDTAKQPDLSALLMASSLVGNVLQPGDLVIYESTVYPGCTEEDCIPVLEQCSGLRFNRDFYVGYSPERINPGDAEHSLVSTCKVTAGSTPAVAEFVDQLYRKIVIAGTWKASSIRVAEAAKVIENTQRDLNIALVNELAVICHQLGIDTQEVLAAAGSKWNFLPFKPGLVGGHCIGVDPYYLTYKAESIGYHPQVILAGRRINDQMGRYLADRVAKRAVGKGINPNGARALVLGLSFKENCADIRNTRAAELVYGLLEWQLDVDVYDPWVDPLQARSELNIDILTKAPEGSYDVLVLAVAHQQFREFDHSQLQAMLKPQHVFFDVQGVYPREWVDERL